MSARTPAAALLTAGLLALAAPDLRAQGQGQDTGAAPAGVPAPSAAPAAGELTPIQREDLRGLLDYARGIPREPTATSAETRMEAWQMVLNIEPGNVEALQRKAQARTDLEAARKREEEKRASEAGARAQREQLNRAQAALDARNPDEAERLVAEVLAASPDNLRALSLQRAVQDARAAREFRGRMFVAAGALVALALGLLALLRRLGGGPAAAAAAQAPRALVKVVDGLGRGRMVPIEKDLFRIGAAEGERPDEKNDLLISDSRALVSRFHCSVFRREDRYYLIDASLNGTRLNGQRVAPGEEHPLEDGDEVVIADVARLKILLT